MTEQWDGRPQNPERDSDGHVWRVDGDIDVYRWVAADQWYRDHKDRWVSPIDLIEEGDTYLGRIVSPAEVNARVAAARRAALLAAAKVASNWNIPTVDVPAAILALMGNSCD